MSQITDHKIRVVAEWAGMWKPGQMCPRGFHQCYHGTNGALLISEHEIPPTGLLAPAGAWALLVALDKAHYRIELAEGRFTVYPIDRNFRGYVPSQPTLLDAAYQLATKEQR